MKYRKVSLMIVAVLLAIAVALPSGIAGVFAGESGAPLYGYPTLTSTENYLELGNWSLHIKWRINKCTITMLRYGHEVIVTTDGDCFAVATLRIPTPAGATPEQCRIIRDGEPYPIPTFVSNSEPPFLYTFLVPILGFDGTYKAVCD